MQLEEGFSPLRCHVKLTVPQGLKPLFDPALVARLKPCPPVPPFSEGPGTNFLPMPCAGTSARNSQSLQKRSLKMPGSNETSAFNNLSGDGAHILCNLKEINLSPAPAGAGGLPKIALRQSPGSLRP